VLEALSHVYETGIQAIHTTSPTAVPTFLKHPAIAIRIGEVGEAGIVSARGIEPGCETSVPGSNGYLVTDLTDVDPSLEQAPPRGLEVGDYEIDVAK